MIVSRKKVAQLVRKNMVNSGIKSITVPMIDLVLEIAFDVISDQLVAGDSIRIVNFGSIIPSVRKAHIGKDPTRDGATIEVPEIRVLRFKPGTTLRDKLNGRYQEPEKVYAYNDDDDEDDE